MNPNTAIQIRNLSKQYRLGQVGTGTLSHDLKRWWTTHVLGKEDPYLKIGEVNDRAHKGQSDYVWALKDINLEIARGDVVGIIGKNGAGKSTLLKLLSRVTKPSTGTIQYRGRIASLLEVGTGFHPEMTGRENIYMNGAIMGMNRHEITRKLDEIIAFAGVERYIDTPVKRYSSGMTVRLGFAVAAHLEPDILVVDEVLAVGDAEFQKKAIGKMQDVSNQGGRTVLFVSHNMAAIKSLCSKAAVLENGKLLVLSDTESAVARYLKGGSNVHNHKIFDETYSRKDWALKEIYVKASNKHISEPINENDQIEIHTLLDISADPPDRYHITYHIYNELGEAMFSFSSSKANNNNGQNLIKGENHLICKVPSGFFQTGSFYLSIFIVIDKKRSVFNERDILSFDIIDGNREIGVYMGREPGYIRPKFDWILQ